MQRSICRSSRNSLFTCGVVGVTTLCGRIVLAADAPPTAPTTAGAFAGLHIPDGAVLLFTAQAEGDQVYTGKAKAGGAPGFEWALKAPDARLFDNAHQEIGKHYAGPTWAGADGSQVVGAAPPQQRVDAPTPGNIPWLLLVAKSHTGTGDFSRAAYILRVATSGGVAPAQPPTALDQETRVAYRATYLFLTAAAPTPK